MGYTNRGRGRRLIEVINLSYALGHFSLGAMLSLLIFRAIDYKSERIKTEDYLRYDIVVACIGGLWAMIPDIPYLFGVMKPLVGGGLCNVFFFHCWLDEFDLHDSMLISGILFGLFLLTVNLLNLDIGRED